VTDECIHGFERELCDICAPRKREGVADGMPSTAARSVTTRRRPSNRKPESLRSTPALARDSAAVAVAAQAAATPVPEFSTQRAYHWTHVSNLPGILEAGALQAGATPVLDVSSEATRALRASVTTASGQPVAAHVPFSLSPHATAWDAVRTGAEGYEWSDAAREARAIDFVMLVVPVASLGDDFVVTEGDAAVEGVRAAAGLDDASSMVRRFSLKDPDLLGPEVLVPGSVPFSSVTLVGVPNDKVRDAVKETLAELGAEAPRVAVYPPWFRPAPVVEAV